MPRKSSKKVSIEKVAREAREKDEQARTSWRQARDQSARGATQPEFGKTEFVKGVPIRTRKRGTKDSFQNFQAGLGYGTNNLTTASNYGFNPVTRNRVELEWIQRGSWLGGVLVDIVADDMTRAGISFKGEIEPDDEAHLQEALLANGVWKQFADGIRWGRLYGGSIVVCLVEGQDMSTPLRIETVRKDQFKGLLVLDRWMVEPSLNDLVTDLGPDLGMPKYYFVNSTAPAIVGQKIHYSRCVRFEGVHLPYWQRVTENLWGGSILERLYDRMIALDSATTGAAQLVYKAYLRTFKIKGYREIVSAGGEAMAGLVKSIQFMREQQSIEGITILDAEDEFEGLVHNAFTGLDEILTQFGQQIAGGAEIPLVRLFGEAPAGLNSSGESDIRTYYDGIRQKQVRTMSVGVRTVCILQAQSLGIKLGKDFGVEFNPLWQMSEEEKANVAKVRAEAISSVNSSGLISDQTALKELKTGAPITGVFDTITDEDIEAADDVAAPKADAMMGGEGGDNPPNGEENPDEPSQKTKDSGKIAQAAAHYVSKSEKATHCGICKFFNESGSCAIVAGTILAEGGCQLFSISEAKLLAGK